MWEQILRLEWQRQCVLSKHSGRFLKKLMLNSATFIHIVFEQKSNNAHFPRGMSYITSFLSTNKKQILRSYVSSPYDSLFLSPKANTHRQIWQQPTLSAPTPPCQGQVEPQFLHFPFFSSSCLRRPFMHLLRKYPEKLGIRGQPPELHSHALRETLQLVTKTARPLWWWRNLDKTPRTQPRRRSSFHPQGTRKRNRALTRSQTSAPARAPPGPPGPRRIPCGRGPACGPIAQERPRPLSALPNRGRSRRRNLAARWGIPGPAEGAAAPSRPGWARPTHLVSAILTAYAVRLAAGPPRRGKVAPLAHAPCPQRGLGVVVSAPSLGHGGARR